jgi:regulator of PEP synthase PpsR (kinase-PPPase family)
VKEGVRPIVISTLVNTEIAQIVGAANALFLDCFEIFISPLEKELGEHASHAIGRSHSVNDLVNYYHRIDAVNYALGHDDGVTTRELSDADIILVGVSRSGKTPTCLYMAMQFGIRAANYPLIPEDFSTMQLPGQLRPLRGRIRGLTIKAERLCQIRNERRPGSTYATLSNCEWEVKEAEALMRQEGIPYLDATSKSVEELATTILHEAKLVRRIY